jgi:MFS family permease
MYMTFSVAYLTSEVGLTPKSAGRMFAVLGLFSIISGVLWGSISDLFGRKWGSLLAYLALAGSYLIFALCRAVPAFYVSSVVFGLTLSSLPTIVAAGAGDAMGGRLAPAALGFITLLFGIGQSLGPAIAGWIKDGTGTFVGAFVLAFIVSLFGAAGSMTLKRKSRE